MLKRYKLVYKKLQTKRLCSTTNIFFNNWLNLTGHIFIHSFFLFFYQTTLIKLKFVKKFKKRFRKQLKKKALFLLFFCKPNYLIHQKFKNARMGKGKGTPLIWVYKPILNKPFAILGGINLLRCYNIINYFKKYLSPYIYLKKM